jgi:polyprenyl P-hydroxybenzoate/phenylacrylic acid decarboxylase-like protein
VALTGASGAIYGYRLLEKLYEAKVELIIIVSDVALEILKRETSINEKTLLRFGEVYKDTEMTAPTASGSYIFDAMVVVPCFIISAS